MYVGNVSFIVVKPKEASVRVVELNMPDWYYLKKIKNEADAESA
jgi:hypothetical protein